MAYPPRFRVSFGAPPSGARRGTPPIQPSHECDVAHTIAVTSSAHASTPPGLARSSHLLRLPTSIASSQNTRISCGAHTIDARTRAILAAKAKIPLNKLPYPIKDYIEQDAYCVALFNRIKAWILSLVAYSPQSHYWTTLTAADNREAWDLDPFKLMIVRCLTKLQGKECGYEAREWDVAFRTGRRAHARKHREAAKGLAQMRTYVERGFPVLKDNIVKGRLILLGNRQPEVLNRDW